MKNSIKPPQLFGCLEDFLVLTSPLEKKSDQVSVKNRLVNLFSDFLVTNGNFQVYFHIMELPRSKLIKLELDLFPKYTF